MTQRKHHNAQITVGDHDRTVTYVYNQPEHNATQISREGKYFRISVKKGQPIY